MSPSNIREYIFSRARRLLIPYLLGIVSITLLRNVFVSIHFYSDDILFLESQNNCPIAQNMYGYLDLAKIGTNIYNALCFNYLPPQYAGPLWFLYALFFTCIIHCFLLYGVNKIEHSVVRNVIWMIVFLFLCAFAWAVSEGFALWSVDIRHRRLPVSYLCFLIGVCFKTVRERYNTTVFLDNGVFNLLLCFLSIITLCILRKNGRIELSQGIITNPFFLIICTITGWVFLRSITDLIKETKIGYLLRFIGQNTISIVFLHLFAFYC